MNWIATVNLQVNDDGDAGRKSTGHRLDMIGSVGRVLAGRGGSGVVLLPAGWFDTGRQPAGSLLHGIEDSVRQVVNDVFSSNADPVACFGIDGSDGKDQICSAVDRRRTLARGRKFCPTEDDEKAGLIQAEGHLTNEAGLPRVFEHHGRRFYLAVCYDVHGIGYPDASFSGLRIDAVLNLVHGFNRRGKGKSDYYFARMCANASRRCGLPVFVAAVFEGGKMVGNWPVGVMWNLGDVDGRTWKWSDNDSRLLRTEEHEATVKGDRALVRVLDF